MQFVSATMERMVESCMQGIIEKQNAVPKCNITRSKKTRMCASCRMCMYSSSLKGRSPEEYVYVQSPQSLSGIHHYFSTKVVFVDVGHAISFHRPSKPLKQGRKKSTKCICKLKDDEAVNEERIYRYGQY